jgi:hypothetical protein
VPFSCSQDELEDDLADELGDGAAQLVSDRMLEWSLGWRGSPPLLCAAFAAADRTYETSELVA